MKRVCYFLCVIIFTLNAYSQDKDIYSIMELLPDTENKGLELLYKCTNINIDDDIGIIKSGWIDLVGDGRNTEYFIYFYIIEDERYYNVILSWRSDNIIYFNSWQASNVKFDITFFKRNNNPYAIIDYRGGSGNYYSFSIFEYNKDESFFAPFKKIYESDFWFGGWFENINQEIVFDIYKENYYLNFEKGEYELIKYR
jgi:hypothetical protein